MPLLYLHYIQYLTYVDWSLSSNKDKLDKDDRTWQTTKLYWRQNDKSTTISFSYTTWIQALLPTGNRKKIKVFRHAQLKAACNLSYVFLHHFYWTHLCPALPLNNVLFIFVIKSLFNLKKNLVINKILIWINVLKTLKGKSDIFSMMHF